MVVQATTPKIVYPYNGVGNYTFNFRIFVAADIVALYVVDGVPVTWVDPTDYSVTINDVDAGTGYITTLSTETTGSLEIYRLLDIIQAVQWPTGTDFDENLIEIAFDKIVMILQQQQVVVDDGATTTNWKGDWVTTTVYAAKDIVKDLGTNNLYFCIVPHTSGTFATDLAAGYWTLAFDASFTSGVSSVSAISPIISSGGGTPVINILAAYLMLAGGAADEVLAKSSGADRDVEWQKALPAGGADGQMLVKASGADRDTEWIDNKGVTPPSGMELQGGIVDMGFEHDTDKDHDIKFLPGACRDSTDASLISRATELTKQIDGTDWVAGDDQPGLLNATAVPVDANKFYHLYALLKDSDSSVDFAFLLNGDNIATYLPSGYSKYRRIGLVYTNGSSNIATFIFQGNELWFQKASEAIFVTGLTSTSYADLSLDTLIPTGIISHILPTSHVDSVSQFHMLLSVDGINTSNLGYSVGTDEDGDTEAAWGSEGGGYGFMSIDDTLYYKVTAQTHKFLIHAMRLIL